LPDIDPSLYTHIIYAFFNLNSKFEISLPDEAKNIAQEINALRDRAKKNNPDIKFMYALGGWTFNEKNETKTIFSDMVGNPTYRKTFINSAIEVLNKLGMDGVDLVTLWYKHVEELFLIFGLKDWEYPGDDKRGGKEADRANFVIFMSEFRKAMNDRGGGLISIASPAGDALKHYELAKLDKHRKSECAHVGSHLTNPYP
jgi:chitinase